LHFPPAFYIDAAFGLTAAHFGKLASGKFLLFYVQKS